MDPRAAALVEELELLPHPEGGYYREIFRSAASVAPGDSRPPRAALTTIYFLLVAGQHSRCHRVRSDEVWHFYEGDPLALAWRDPAGSIHQATLAAATPGARPVCVIPANSWQTARPTGAFSLVGCTVAPGFDFADFEMLDDSDPLAQSLCRNAT
jgi:predicted cupin superfamily sugar epimerase